MKLLPRDIDLDMWDGLLVLSVLLVVWGVADLSVPAAKVLAGVAGVVHAIRAGNGTKQKPGGRP